LVHPTGNTNGSSEAFPLSHLYAQFVPVQACVFQPAPPRERALQHRHRLVERLVSKYRQAARSCR
jgi:hypothetical protein